MDVIVEVLVPVFCMIVGAVCIIFLIVLGFYTVDYIANIAEVVVFIDGKEVYRGEDKFVVWGQMGEVGNKYSVEIYEKTFWGRFIGKKVNSVVGSDLVVEDRKY